MELTVRPSDDGQYIEVTVVGELTREGAVQMVTAEFELGRELGIFCFLIDVTRAHSVQTVVEHVRHTLEDVPSLEPPDVASCAALLVSSDDHSHDFQAAFARSQGINMSLYWDRQAAIRHLKEAAPRINITPPEPT